MDDLIAQTNPNSMVFNREIIDLIKATVAPSLTDTELQLYLYTAQRMNLDPLARQIYAVKRAGRMTIQTGIDGFRVIANRSGLAGIDEAIHDSDDAEHPKWSKVTVYRMIDGQRIPYTATARWDEYAVRDNAMWKRMPYLMLDKCAEALALRKGFPAELSGVYTTDEMMQAGDMKNEPIPDFTDDEVLAKAFRSQSGSRVTIGEIIVRDDAKATLEKLLTMVEDPLDKAKVTRAIAMLKEKELKEVG